ncbi:hypothetical protein [Capnocytophaga granulosa]|uniref:hypothetical protein n=1 Tax=Capnocytophaga granulosa TaxID=45242 RepID=UPI003857A2E8
MTDFTEEKLNNLLEGGYAKAVGEDKETFIAFYAYLFNDNDPCPSCPHKLSSYWDRLAREGKSRLITIQKKTEEMARNKSKNTDGILQEGAFRLRGDIHSLAMDFGSSEFFNNDTLTNDVALRYLSINPNRIANFEKYPKGWEQLVQEYANAEQGGETEQEETE